MSVDESAQPREFLGPHEVRAGDGAVEAVGPLMARWARTTGGAVLAVTDAQLSRRGALEPVVQSLADAAFDVEVFDQISAEPNLETAEQVSSVVRAHPFVGIVGFGGGSALDLSKVAAAAATSDGTPNDLVGVDRLLDDPLPMVLVPTTAGTGAETTRIAMLAIEGKKKIINDRRLVPEAAVLDPALTLSLPQRLTAATGLDALSHALEAHISTAANGLTEAMSREAVALLSAALPRAYDDGGDLGARRSMLHGAHLAGRALNAGTVLGHSVAYTIANRAQLAHGVTCAMALPFCLAYSGDEPAVSERLDRIATAVADPAVRSGRDLLRWLRELSRALQVPASLDAVGIAEEEMTAMAQECLELYPRPNNAVALELAPLARMYRALWRGDLDRYVAGKS